MQTSSIGLVDDIKWLGAGSFGSVYQLTRHVLQPPPPLSTQQEHQQFSDKEMWANKIIPFYVKPPDTTQKRIDCSASELEFVQDEIFMNYMLSVKLKLPWLPKFISCHQENYLHAIFKQHVQPHSPLLDIFLHDEKTIDTKTRKRKRDRNEDEKEEEEEQEEIELTTGVIHMITELAPIRLIDILKTCSVDWMLNHEFQKVVFQMIFGLLSIYYKTGGLHNDVKIDNVLLMKEEQLSMPKTFVIHTVNKQRLTFQLKNCHYKPLIFDFGLATFPHNVKKKMPYHYGTPDFFPPEYHIERCYAYHKNIYDHNKPNSNCCYPGMDRTQSGKELHLLNLKDYQDRGIASDLYGMGLSFFMMFIGDTQYRNLFDGIQYLVESEQCLLVCIMLQYILGDKVKTVADMLQVISDCCKLPICPSQMIKTSIHVKRGRGRPLKKKETATTPQKQQILPLYKAIAPQNWSNQYGLLKNERAIHTLILQVLKDNVWLHGVKDRLERYHPRFLELLRLLCNWDPIERNPDTIWKLAYFQNLVVPDDKGKNINVNNTFVINPSEPIVSIQEQKLWMQELQGLLQVPFLRKEVPVPLSPPSPSSSSLSTSRWRCKRK